MFKGFQDTSRAPQFHGFPNINFGMNNEAYGFGGCINWFDAGLFVNNGNPANLDLVTKWGDRLTTVYFEQLTAANQATFISSDASFNNYPVIDFDSNTKRMQLNGNKTIGLSNNFTVAVIAKVNTIVARNILLGYGLSPIGTSMLLLGGTSTTGEAIDGIGIWDVSGGGSNSSVIKSTVEDTATHIIIITNDEIIVDGVSDGSGNWIPSASWDSLGSSSSGQVPRAKVAEIITYNQKISSENAVMLSDNINAKYAIY